MAHQSRDMQYVLSYLQVKPILQARAANLTTVEVSLDLGLTTAVLTLHPSGVTLPDGRSLTWEQLQEICDNEQVCFQVNDDHIEKIQRYSGYLSRFYSLMPTESAPTMLVSGIPMHRIKGTNPYRDTLSKIKAIAPLRGQVLDTAMGLGYTAIEAAKTAAHVTTIELDPTVLEICRCNPWSQELFHNPKITRIIGDAGDKVEQFEKERFTRIIHDPPTFSLAGELYSARFYRQLYRILRPKGKLFHYIGDPKSKSGSSVTRGVVRRLQEAGFRRIVPRPQAFGVVAHK